MLGDSKAVRNAAFYTELEINGKTDLICKLEELFEKAEEEFRGYWEKFGYKYFAMLEMFSRTEILTAIKEKRVKNNFYAESILNLYYGDICEPNREIVSAMKSGIDKFMGDTAEIAKNITIDIAISGIRYLANYATQYDVKNIYGAVRKVTVEGEEHFLPITPHEQYSFGIVYPWPGMDTAETELLARTVKAADNIGFKCVMLSDFGQILDETQHATKEYVQADSLDYVMTTHYESNKTVDSYYYHLLWNPPDISLNTAYYEEKVLDNYIMNDDYLIYDFGGMSNHLKSMLINKPRTLENASTFVGSFPKSAVMEPNLSNPKIFYCGMNWEKAVGDSNRHAGLFELLDKTEKIKFYGPDVVESWGEIRPWEGYQCYQHPIPFDGFSILKEINSCGICLAISSDAHRRAGAVTNRAYEACAAGAVIISDNNVFMEEYFKDSVLYVTYNKNNPQDTFQQIMEKYQWIVEHKEQALEMAKKSQQIFIEKFCMEKGILDVTKNHYRRFKTIESDLFAKAENKTVLVTRVLNTLNEDEIDKHLASTIKNITNQYYRNIVLGIACDKKVEDAVKKYAAQLPVNVCVVGMELFDEKGSRSYTDGQAIRKVQNHIKHDYFINTHENEFWFYDHITTLIRSIEDEQSIGAYAGLLSEDAEKMRRTYLFDRLTQGQIYYQNHPKNTPVPGQIMFCAEAEEYVPEYMLGCLDGEEHVAYSALLWIRYHKQLAFSKRMTCVWEYERKSLTCSVMDATRQIRFIRGLVRYDLPSTGIAAETGNAESTRSRREFLLTMPLMQSINVRLWRKISSRFNKKTGLGKAVYNKYQKQLKKYNELMTVLRED